MKRAIVLVDHGSKRAEANEALERVAELLRGLVGDSVVVEAAHMELASPTIDEAFARCRAAGALEVVVVPYFLSPGRHVSEDIPRMAQEAARAHEGMVAKVTAPLGPDLALAELARARFEAALDEEASG
ncbi:MAG: cobalamin biosynthesis protein CbiX [Myxococcales bacterium]|jgi:sirohydrochlorin ferrochelatase|nr:cobalamin biosynthesis protein CbiX [Myxococcales bacterium]